MTADTGNGVDMDGMTDYLNLLDFLKKKYKAINTTKPTKAIISNSWLS